MKIKKPIRLFNRDAQGKISGRPVQLLKDEKSKTEESTEEKVSGSTVIEGYATLYNVKTDLYWYSLSIDPAAFKEMTAALGDIVSLFNHDWNYLLGRTPDTLKLDASKEYGLWQETILPDHDLGKRIAEDVRRGALTQQSVTFFIEEYAYTEGRAKDELDNLHVTKASLVDVSVVTFGQYSQTTIGTQKLHAEPSPKELYEEFLRELKEAPAVKEQLARTLDIQLKLQEQRKRKARGILGI